MGKRKKRKIPLKQPPQGKPTEYGADVDADSRRDNGIDLNHRQEKASMAPSERNWRLSAPKNPPQKAGKKPEAGAPPSASQRKNPAVKKVLPKSENQRSPNGEDRHQAGAEKESPDSASSKNEAAPKAKSRLKFDKTDGDAGILKKGTGAAARKTAAAAEAFGHEKVHEAEQENSGVEAAHKTELAAEVGVRKAGHFANEQYRKKQAEQKASRLQESASEESSTKFRHEGSSASKETPKAEKSRQTGHFYQKQRNKKYASEAVKEGRDAAEHAAETASAITQRVSAAVRHFVQSNKRSLYALAAALLALFMLLSMLHSCSTLAGGTFSTVTVSSWPADDTEITAADLYYTRLEAELQQKINNIESTYPGYDEYNYNVGEIGHDPVVLISYLCAKYGSFQAADMEGELDTLFALQYQFKVETKTEQRTVTKTVRVGESLGTVVTSGYCSCSICCGQWAGGPTASGVYPTANHTIAVDASNPIVPMGTEIIMNGTLYKVEDTGAFARYGVDFDVYYDSHAEASAHGHQTWEAYYAGGNGTEIQVTTTEDVRICNVTLTSQSLQNLIGSRMDSEQQELYSVYLSTRGNRQFLGSPFNANWYGNVSSYYGYRIHPISGNLQIHRGLDIAAPQGTEILAVHDGTVTTAAYDSSYGNYIVLENDDAYKTKYAHCSSLKVSQGQEVKKGDVIALVGSTGNSTGPHLHIEFLYQDEYLNPYFYLSVGAGSLYGNGFGYTGDVDALDDARYAALIQEAEKYLGMPYVWGGSSPSTGFDCSGFVSYVFTHSGVYNMGRLTAQGIYDICTPVSPSDAKPGDIIFFKGTYDTPDVSHVGIYVGNGQMIHAGDPIQYTSINTAYWQNHFFAFGRVG